MDKNQDSQSENPFQEKLSGLENLLSSIDHDLQHSSSQETSPKAVKTTDENRQESKEHRIEICQGFSLTLNQDKTKASLNYRPALDRAETEIKAGDIQDWLNQHGVIFGVIEKNILKAATLLKQNPESELDVVIAQGYGAVNGQKTTTAYWIGNEPMAKDQGAIHAKNGQILLKIHPGKPGAPGKNVLGESIEPQTAKDISWTAGLNVQESDPGEFTALSDGLIQIEGNLLSIIEESRDAKCSIELAEKNMKAFLSITPASGKGRPVTLRDVREKLAEIGAARGIDEAAIQNALHQACVRNLPVERMMVAQGRFPTRGNDGRVFWHIHPQKQVKRYTIDEHGNVDLRDLREIICVNEGDRLVSVKEPTKGEDGFTVLGERLEGHVGKRLPIKPKANIALKQNGADWHASCAGMFLLEDNSLSIQPLYQVEGDVDYSVGNIDFLGDVIIEGAIMDGFKVKATGDIVVQGSIEAADVKAGGSIEVKNGIFGKEKGVVQAQKNVVSSFLQNATVYAGKDIIIGSQILNSKVSARHSVKVLEGKGCIVGGETYAGVLIHAKTIGSEYGTKTRLEAGIDYQTLQKMIEIGHQKKPLEAHLKTLLEWFEQEGLPLEELERRESLPEPLNKAIAKKSQLKNMIDSLQNNYNQLAGDVHITNHPEIIASVSFMPDVLVRMHEKKYKFPYPVENCRVVFEPKKEIIQFKKYANKP